VVLEYQSHRRLPAVMSNSLPDLRRVVTAQQGSVGVVQSDKPIPSEVALTTLPAESEQS
jgi:hypothetical protein